MTRATRRNTSGPFSGDKRPTKPTTGADVGTPVVALFSSQNAVIWRPVGERHTVLQTTLPCACFPAGTLPEPCVPGDSYRSYCVRQLGVEQVYAAVARSLAPRR